MQASSEEGTKYEPAFSRKSAEEKGLRIVGAEERPGRVLRLEGLYPAAASWIVFALTYYYHRHTLLFSWDAQAELVSKIVDLSAGFVAYGLTVITLLPAITDRASVQLLKVRGAYPFFVGYVGRALGGAAWLGAFSLFLKVSFSHVSQHTAFWAPACSSLWWASLTYAVLALYRISYLLLLIVSKD